MQKIGQFALGVFLHLGERAALIVLIILAVIFLSEQTSQPVFSQDEARIGLVSEGKPPSVTFTSTPTPTATPSPTPTPTETPIPTAIPPSIPPTATPTPIIDSNDNAVWDRLAACESKGNWSIDTGNGYFGGLQFSQSAWESVGGTGNPAHASRDEQVLRGKVLQSLRGWGVWGLCAKKLGLN